MVDATRRAKPAVKAIILLLAGDNIRSFFFFVVKIEVGV
jgi:hypothetical protein